MPARNLPGCVDLVDRIFSDKDRDIGITSPFLPIVKEIEILQEEGGCLVTMEVLR